LWKENDNLAIKLPQWKSILDEFAYINPHGILNICGGEPTLFKDLIPLCNHSKGLGLRTCVITSGFHITETVAKELMENIHEITVSLDSPIESKHDHMRGHVGSFAKACNAIRLFSQYSLPDSLVKVAALITKHNIILLESWHDMVFGLGANKLEPNLLQPTFGMDGNDIYFKNNALSDFEMFNEQIERCKKRWGIVIDSDFMNGVKEYCDGVKNNDLLNGWGIDCFTSQVICKSHTRNIVIDRFGKARFCFGLPENGWPINKFGDLLNFWENGERSFDCKKPCGIGFSSGQPAGP
jgi:MoaA/NifB/PqqE/SkfB family radical SAM enzyme